MSVDLVLTGLVQGLILCIIAYAVMVPFRLLNFPDLTSEGAYPLGASLCALAVLNDLSLGITLLVGILGAGLLGVATSLIHLRLRVNTLLAGIILSTMAYSVNLRILGKPNAALFNHTTLFTHATQIQIISILLLILFLFFILIILFLKTDFGLKLRAVGYNPSFATKQNISITRYTILGLFIGGALSGLAGCLMVHLQSYADVGMGVGIVIHGLASLMIGEALLGLKETTLSTKTLFRQILAPLLGALLYQQIQGIALSLGLTPSDLKFFTGAIVLCVLGLRQARQ